MRAFAVVAALAVLIAACSSDHKTGTASSSPSSSHAPPSSSTAASASSQPATGGATWTTWGHDAARSGVSSDGPSATGLHNVWASDALDGEVYAQPLVVGDQVLVATENDSMYAFDARSGAARWQQTIGTPVSGRSLPCGNVDPLGITSTPVADPATNRLYVVGMVQPMHHELFALALDTGAVLFHRPIDAAGADPSVHNQRGRSPWRTDACMSRSGDGSATAATTRAASSPFRPTAQATQSSTQ